MSKSLIRALLMAIFLHFLAAYLLCGLLFASILNIKNAYALQSVLEEIKSHEPQLNRLKEKAQQLWEEQAASKSFMHRVSQLSSQYLALSNLTKVMQLPLCAFMQQI